jgi:hypothetical protein
MVRTPHRHALVLAMLRLVRQYPAPATVSASSSKFRSRPAEARHGTALTSRYCWRTGVASDGTLANIVQRYLTWGVPDSSPSVRGGNDIRGYQQNRGVHVVAPPYLYMVLRLLQSALGPSCFGTIDKHTHASSCVQATCAARCQPICTTIFKISRG